MLLTMRAGDRDLIPGGHVATKFDVGGGWGLYAYNLCAVHCVHKIQM